MNIEKHYTWGQFLKHVDWIDEEFNPASNRESQELSNGDWHGTKTFEEALNLAKFGWTEKLKEIRQLELQKIPDFKQMFETKTKYGLAGGSVDIGRYLIGIPECMQQQVIHSGFHIPAGFARVVVNVSCNSNVSANEMFMYGLKISNIIYTFEIANIRTEILLTDQTKNNNNNTYRIFIKLKGAEDSFYLEKLLFPIAHISFQRRLAFSEYEKNDENIRNAFGFFSMGGYGKSSSEYEGKNDPNTLYFSGIHFDQEQINKKLSSILTKQQKFI